MLRRSFRIIAATMLAVTTLPTQAQQRSLDNSKDAVAPTEYALSSRKVRIEDCIQVSSDDVHSARRRIKLAVKFLSRTNGPHKGTLGRFVAQEGGSCLLQKRSCKFPVVAGK